MFVSLSCLYLLTYRWSHGSDRHALPVQRRGESAHFGDWREDLTADDNFPTPTNAPANSVYPLKKLIDDPLTVIVATPLYWLADKLPGAGAYGVAVQYLRHGGGCLRTVRLCADAGYDERVGAGGAGLWRDDDCLDVQQNLSFQENLPPLITMSLALALERWRRSGFRSLRALLAAIVLALCLPYSKWSSVIAAPGSCWWLPVVIKRDSRVGKRIPLVEVILLAGIVVGLVPLGYTDCGVLPGIDWFNSHVSKFQIAPQYIQPAIQSYLFSIGKGKIWGTSPIVLLALPGCWMLFLAGRTRYLWVMMVVLAAYALGMRCCAGFTGSAVCRGHRFLVPTIPFLMLCTLPVLQWLVTLSPQAKVSSKTVMSAQARKRLMWMIFACWRCMGVWIQLSVLALRWTVYPTPLPPDAGV
ncbi:MAG: hypothetical protein U0694_12875 [Anaerolineae bacterium]